MLFKSVEHCWTFLSLAPVQTFKEYFGGAGLNNRMPTIPSSVSGVADGSPWKIIWLWFLMIPTVTLLISIYWFQSIDFLGFFSLLTLVWAARVVEKSTESAKPASLPAVGRALLLWEKNDSLRVARPNNSVCIHVYTAVLVRPNHLSCLYFSMLILLVSNLLIVTRQSDFPWLSMTFHCCTFTSLHCLKPRQKSWEETQRSGAEVPPLPERW